MMPFYENEDKTITSYINNKDEYVLIKMEGDISEHDYKEVFNLLLDKDKTLNFHKVLLNQENIGNVPAMARAWLLMKFMPKVQKQFGTSFKVAIVKSSTPLQRIAQQVLLKSLMKINGNFKISYFEDKNEAKDWLTE